MKLDPTRQQVIDDLIHDAHFADKRIVTSEVAARIVDELRNLEASGHAWVEQYLDTLAAKGAAKVYADWRRRYSHKGKTRRGTEVEVPVYGAVREVDDDGTIVSVQLALFSMTLEQVRARRDHLAKTRDTLSAEVRFFTDLADLMEADSSLATAGDALARLEAA